MPELRRIRKRHVKVAIGDMVDRVTIHLRSITAPQNGGVDFGESFTPKRTVWSTVNTVSGKTVFDQHNVERDVTHEIFMRYVEGLTSEDWIELANGDLLDILPTEDIDIRSEFMRLKCSARGPKDVEANQL